MVDKLIQLKKEHPELPIITMVFSEVVGEDDNGYWLGKIDNISIDKYYRGEERVYLYNLTDYEDIFWKEDISEEEANKRFEELPWIEAIIIWIETCPT